MPNNPTGTIIGLVMFGVITLNTSNSRHQYYHHEANYQNNAPVIYSPERQPDTRKDLISSRSLDSKVGK